FSGEGQKLGSL
nr:Chain X, UBX domain-containing protein 2B [Homo sapiens]